jgi:DNA-binding NarL/FixJ family response regulator
LGRGPLSGVLDDAEAHVVDVEAVRGARGVFHLPDLRGAALHNVVDSRDVHLHPSGFRMLLERADDIELTGEASTGAQALERLRADRPDVVLMDIRMPVMDGLEATRRIADDPELAGVRVIVLTTFGCDDYVFDALHAGASGFLLEDVEPDEVRHAVRVVARGEALLSRASPAG